MPVANTPMDAEGDRSEEFSTWLSENYSSYVRLKDAVVTTVASLLVSNGINALALDGRTKELRSAVEKVKRKAYLDPATQMTDIVGARIIVYFESDITRVSEVIRSAFEVDEENSSNADEKLSTDQVGYRSVHFVCDLGRDRIKLPEFKGLKGLKFEIQVRTVLQHAWAELAHDRNYKFSGSLPRHLERRLFLLAGLLETADQGFNDLSLSLDEYLSSVTAQSAKGELEIEVDSVSVQGFMEQWARDNELNLNPPQKGEPAPADLIRELKEFGIRNLADLSEIVPAKFAEQLKGADKKPTLQGVVRAWMLVHDHNRFISDVTHYWVTGSSLTRIIALIVGDEKAAQIAQEVDQAKSSRPKPKNLR